MSGLAVGFGSPEEESIQRMMDKVRHRGPSIQGVFKTGKVVMAQNYLAADVVGLAQGEDIPKGLSGLPSLRICYDGQMGNTVTLAGEHRVPCGPCWDERLLLELYADHGRDFLPFLTDAVFASVISDGHRLLAARDLLGIKTLFYGRGGDTLYFASELKSILEVTDQVFEFPPGHYMDRSGDLRRFAKLPGHPPPFMLQDVQQMIGGVRAIVERSVLDRVDFSRPTGCLLSGGIDSSAIAAIAARHYVQTLREPRRLRTFAVGTGDGTDVENARLVARHLGTEHHETVVGLEDLLAVLPDVIYYLESFDPWLVRSSVASYLVSKQARESGMEVLLSGEGGDAVFCGYDYLKDYPLEELDRRQKQCLRSLHNHASLRLDRMNQCNGIRVVAPLISGELLAYSLAIPARYKIREEGGRKIEKWIFRKAFEWDLPEQVVWRAKQEFSQGSGAGALLTRYFDREVPDSELAVARQKYPFIRSKEELHYFNLFTKHFGDGKAVDTVGQWVSPQEKPA